MTRHIGESVQVRHHQGQLIAFTWRGATYPVRVIDMWRRATRWWEPGEAADRTYYRCACAAEGSWSGCERCADAVRAVRDAPATCEGSSWGPFAWEMRPRREQKCAKVGS